MCSTGRSARNAANDAARAEAERADRVRAATGTINDQFARFDDSFFDRRGAEYTAYAAPQVEDQYARARKDLTFALADAGLTRSSVGAERLSDLDRDYTLRKLEVADAARGYGQQARQDVEQARRGLIQQASATGDAALTGTSAINEANRLAVGGQNFSPIGALFQNVASGIGVARNAAAAQEVRDAGARVYQPTGKSSRVVN